MSGYKAYKPTGVEWIGEIPEHWHIKRLKDVANATLGKMLQNDDSGSDDLKPYLRSFNVQWDRVDLSEVKEMWLSEYEQEQYRLKKYDLVVSEGGEVGRCAIWLNELEECYIQNSVHKVTCNIRILPYFLLYQFTTAGKAGFFEKIINKVSIGHLTREKLVSVNFLLPPTEEQLSIANYIDHQTQKIDRLISNKKAQAEKLKELRRIVINNAVTKGLNPNAELHESGIDWLGNIPKHWEVKRLKKFVSKIGSGVTPKGGSEVYEENGIPLFRSQNIHFDGLRTDDIVFITKETHQAMSGSKVETNDVLLNITGASIGRCYFYDGSLGEANVNQHVCIIRTKSKFDYRYLQQFLSSDCGQSQIFMGQNGTSREGLTFQDIKNIIIPTPPLDEQIEITEFVKVRTNALAKLINNTEAQIEKLLELRKIKIYEAVTGKIKVTNYGEATA